ncbi:MAG TPA: sigma-70 family RNA polymerase sigma factor [Longimicrobiales bacterium]|nr:sigma-70 family RNA polymerase sigma factor [Longimicrobiales bacterium]
MKLAPPSRAEVALFRAGDPDHFRLLVRQHGPALRGMAASFARDEDELDDLCQDIWLSAYVKRSAYRGDGPLLAWLLTLARRKCISRVRANGVRTRAAQRLLTELGPNAHAEQPTPLDDAERHETRARLAAALRPLTARQRLAILLRLWHGHGPDETAKLMGCTQVTVRSLIHKGLIRLRKTQGDPS